MPVAPALSLLGRAAPWALTAASVAPEAISGLRSVAPGAISGLQSFLKGKPAPYRPGGGGMGGRRGTRGAAPSPSVMNLPAGYRESELQAGQAAENFRPGAGFPGQRPTSPQARAEAQERSRVAQLTEQDPLFKKYKVAELTKAYNTATPEEKERIGLEIWATTNPQLASKVRPGQVGYQTSAAMSGTQVFGSEIPGITEASYQQAVERANKIPFSGMVAPDMSAYGMGTNAIQFGTTAPGTPPLSMIGEDVFNKGFDVPSSKDLSQTQLARLKRLFEGGLK